MRKLYTLLVISILLVSALAYTAPIHKPVKKAKTSTTSNELLYALTGINWTKIVHAKLEIYKNGKLAQVIDPDPFTKNIQYLFNTIIFFTSYSTPTTNLEPIDINGVHQALTGGTGIFIGNGKIVFYLSSSTPPSDIWNTVSLPSSELNITQQYSRYYFNATYGCIDVTGWSEATTSFNASSIYIVASINKGTIYSGWSTYKYLIAIDPLNLTINQGDNVTITWTACFPLVVQNNKGQTILLRNTLGILFAWISGQGSVIDINGNTIGISYIALGNSGKNYLCASSNTYTSFSANPGGTCKSVHSYYSQQKDIAILYALFYQDELSTINTVYREVYVLYNPYSTSYDTTIVIYEISNINAVVNNEAYASIVVTDA